MDASKPHGVVVVNGKRLPTLPTTGGIQERITALRRALGLNMAQAAQLAGMKKQQWAKYESTKKRVTPHGKNIERIARALQSAADTLRFGSPSDSQVPLSIPSSTGGDDMRDRFIALQEHVLDLQRRLAVVESAVERLRRATPPSTEAWSS